MWKLLQALQTPTQCDRPRTLLNNTIIGCKKTGASVLPLPEGVVIGNVGLARREMAGAAVGRAHRVFEWLAAPSAKQRRRQGSLGLRARRRAPAY